MKAVSSLTSAATKAMKFTVPRLFTLLALSLTIPVAITAKRSNFAVPGNPFPVFPSATPAALTKAASATSMLFYTIGLDNQGLPYEAFLSAMKGFSTLRERQLVSEDSILTIVDFSKSSREKRLYVVDLKKQGILFHTVVAHGRNSGQEFARSFSNKPSSNKSSLGFYVTEGTYMGSNGYSLRLQGVETGINDMALPRAIVMHGAEYANESVIRTKGFLGRSFGCPAVPQKLTRPIIDRIKNGNAIFVYYPDPSYMKRSKLLNS
jgi:hypothetical protein